MAHFHDSCTPDLARDLAVTGAAGVTGSVGAVDLRTAAGTAAGTDASPEVGSPPPRSVPQVVELTPLSVPTAVIDRSAQVPVVVLLGSPVGSGMSALRRELAGAASSAGLRWILAVADVDRFPQLATAFRPASLPTVTVVADGTGVAAWTPPDALGDGGVDCLDWVETVVARVAPRLAGPPEDTVPVGGEVTVAENGVADITRLAGDPRLRRAATLVSSGDPEGAVALYDVLLPEYPDPVAQRILRRARSAVGVLARTRDLDQRSVYTVLAGARRLLDAGDGGTGGTPPAVGDLLRTADVLVLGDRPVDAVDLLSGALSRSAAGRPAGEREQLRVRALDLLRLLEPGTAVAERARRRLASALF